MPRILKYILLGAGCAVLLGIIGFVGIGAMWWWGLTHETVRETKGPVSLKKATGKCPIPLPPDARNIQYHLRAGGLQSYHAHVRFEAPISTCHAWAKTIYDEYERRMPNIARRPTFSPVIPVASTAKSPTELPWFDPDHIAHGVVAGSGYGHQPQIWINEGRGIFYYSVSD